MWEICPANLEGGVGGACHENSGNSHELRLSPSLNLARTCGP